jgi:hypothetical protein
MSRRPIREQEICWEQVLEIEGTKTSNFTRKISRAGLKNLGKHSEEKQKAHHNTKIISL